MRANEFISESSGDNFNRWFGASQVVDASGKPLVVYHGTSADINSFAGKDGFNFFAETPAGAQIYSSGKSPSMYPVFLSIQKPLHLGNVDFGDEVTPNTAAKILKTPLYMLAKPQFGKTGHLWEYLNKDTYRFLSSVYDGIISNEDGNEIYVTFKPNQIKSATGNSGEYSASPDITKESMSYQPPAITVGDEVKVGKFKNRKAEVKGFTKDKHNQPVLKTNKGEVQLFKPRISKLMKEEELTELFAPGKDWKWSFTGSEEAVAVFHVGEIPYMFRAYTYSDTPGVWEVEFKNAERGQSKSSKFGLTGTGNSAEVMSTIADIMRAFLEKYKDKIERLVFTAKESSRQALYARMAKRLMPGWKLVQIAGDFILTAPR